MVAYLFFLFIYVNETLLSSLWFKPSFQFCPKAGSIESLLALKQMNNKFDNHYERSVNKTARDNKVVYVCRINVVMRCWYRYFEVLLCDCLLKLPQVVYFCWKVLRIIRMFKGKKRQDHFPCSEMTEVCFFKLRSCVGSLVCITVEPRLSGPQLSGLFLWSRFFHEY